MARVSRSSCSIPEGSTREALAPNLGPLAARFHVFTPERRGHGHTPDVEGPFSYELMAQNTIAVLEAVVGEPAHLVGSSDGATVALLAALRRPELVRRVVLVAGVFHRDGWPTAVADPYAPPELLANLYGEVSPTAPSTFRSWPGSWPGCTRRNRRSPPPR